MAIVCECRLLSFILQHIQLVVNVLYLSYMNRRHFLRNSTILSLGGMSGAAIFLDSCTHIIAGGLIFVEFLIEEGAVGLVDSCIEGAIADGELAKIVEGSFEFFESGIYREGESGVYRWSIKEAIVGSIKSKLKDEAKRYILSFNVADYEQGIKVYQNITPHMNANVYQGHKIEYTNVLGIYPAVANDRLTACDCEKLKTYSPQDLEVITYEILARQGFDIPSDNMYFTIFNTGFNSSWYHQILKVHHRYDTTRDNLIGYPRNNYQIVQAVISRRVVRKDWLQELPPYPSIQQHLIQQKELQVQQEQRFREQQEIQQRQQAQQRQYQQLEDQQQQFRQQEAQQRQYQQQQQAQQLQNRQQEAQQRQYQQQQAQQLQFRQQEAQQRQHMQQQQIQQQQYRQQEAQQRQYQQQIQQQQYRQQEAQQRQYQQPQGPPRGFQQNPNQQRPMQQPQIRQQQYYPQRPGMQPAFRTR